jgi:hypothetical protein
MVRRSQVFGRRRHVSRIRDLVIATIDTKIGLAENKVHQRAMMLAGGPCMLKRREVLACSAHRLYRDRTAILEIFYCLDGDYKCLLLFFIGYFLDRFFDIGLPCPCHLKNSSPQCGEAYQYCSPIRPGQDATVKRTAYESWVYGTLPAKVNGPRPIPLRTGQTSESIAIAYTDRRIIHFSKPRTANAIRSCLAWLPLPK